MTIDICLPITIARHRLIARMQFPEPLPSLVAAALNRRTAGTAAAYVTKTTVKMQIWFDSSEGSTLILQQSKEQPVLEGRIFSRRQLA